MTSSPPAGPPWTRGVATGIGSLPGTDPLEAARLVVGELPDLPHVPELPERGPGASVLARGALALAELHIDWQPAGWRLVPRPGTDERRARDLLARDLDAFQEAAAAVRGPVKIQAAGPWTLAAGLELPRGDKVLRDPGAVSDLGGALAEGLAAQVRDLRRRLPAAGALLVQLDEPALPRVLVGHLRTASGFDTLPVPDRTAVLARLRDVTAAITAAGGVPMLSCLGDRPPMDVLAAAGARALAVDATTLPAAADDAIGTWVEAGGWLLLGLVPPAADGPPASAATLAAPARALWGRLGFDPRQLADVAVATPVAGLAGVSPAQARAAMTAAREVGRVLAEAPEDGR